MRHKNEIELQAERRVANAAFGFLSLSVSVFLKESSEGNLLRLDRLKGPMAVSRTDTHTHRQIDRHMCVCLCVCGRSGKQQNNSTLILCKLVSNNTKRTTKGQSCYINFVTLC